METSDQVFAKTNRLILRRFHVTDIEPFHLYRADPEVAKFQSWHDYQYHEAEAFVKKQSTHHPRSTRYVVSVRHCSSRHESINWRLRTTYAFR